MSTLLYIFLAMVTIGLSSLSLHRLLDIKGDINHFISFGIGILFTLIVANIDDYELYQMPKLGIISGIILTWLIALKYASREADAP